MTGKVTLVSISTSLPVCLWADKATLSCAAQRGRENGAHNPSTGLGDPCNTPSPVLHQEKNAPSLQSGVLQERWKSLWGQQRGRRQDCAGCTLEPTPSSCISRWQLGGRQHSCPLWLLGTHRVDWNLLRPARGLSHLLPSPKLDHSHRLFYHGHPKGGRN